MSQQDVFDDDDDFLLDLIPEAYSQRLERDRVVNSQDSSSDILDGHDESNGSEAEVSSTENNPGTSGKRSSDSDDSLAKKRKCPSQATAKPSQSEPQSAGGANLDEFDDDSEDDRAAQAVSSDVEPVTATPSTSSKQEVNEIEKLGGFKFSSGREVVTSTNNRASSRLFNGIQLVPLKVVEEDIL
jgi:hypothetical protein